MSDLSDQTAGIESVPAVPSTNIIAANAGTRVFVALPWQKHTNPITSFCVNGLLDRRRTTACLNFGDAFVSHSRNTCAELFLASDCEWSLWVDDDMLIPFGNAKWFNAYSGFDLPEKFAGLHAIDRLLSHKKTLVGGLYFGRHPHGAPMYAEGMSNPAEADFARRAPMDVVKPTRWVATGCLLIHRSVFEDIEKKFPKLGRTVGGKHSNFFSSSEHNLMDRIERCRDMLSKGPMDGDKAFKAFQQIEDALRESRNKSSLGMGEDVAFCVRATESGHIPHIDMGLVCGHIGHMVYGPKNTSRRR
jgi:hypothetical protein